ncbi:MAG: ADP-glyceromanno-heptose 6-epimerase, partial [Ignavibacteria bacterium]
NVGSGKAHTWNELAYAIFKAMNIEPQIEYVEMPDNIRNQYQYFSQANISKLRTAGYKNDIMNLEESVKDYIVNYLSKDKYLSVK